jgi:hypothetical protein
MLVIGGCWARDEEICEGLCGDRITTKTPRHKELPARTFHHGHAGDLWSAATRRGERPTADESAVEKAATSRRTPKFGFARMHKLFAGAGRGNNQKGLISAGQKPRPYKTVMGNPGEGWRGFAAEGPCLLSAVSCLLRFRHGSHRSHGFTPSRESLRRRANLCNRCNLRSAMVGGESAAAWGIRSSPVETPTVFVGALREAPSNAGSIACQSLWRASSQPVRPSTSREEPHGQN